MNNSGYVLFFVAVLLVCLQTIQGLKCYECIPNNKKDCIGDDKDWKLKFCDGGDQAYCRKMEQKVLGDLQVVRQCGLAEGGKDKAFYATANDYVKASVYHCSDEDGCNSGVSLVASGFLLALSLGIAAYFR